jgi:GNAT superfamily N-acetyltransferase
MMESENKLSEAIGIATVDTPKRKSVTDPAAACGYRRRRRSRRPLVSRCLASVLPKASNLPGGPVVLIRNVSPGDTEQLRRMYSRLSPASIYQRFHAAFPQVPESMVMHALEADHHHKVSLVAAVGSEVVGQAMYVLSAKGEEAEVAIVVEDCWQRRGIGTLLLSRLAGKAKRRGVKVLTGAVLYENLPMRADRGPH